MILYCVVWPRHKGTNTYILNVPANFSCRTWFRQQLGKYWGSLPNSQTPRWSSMPHQSFVICFLYDSCHQFSLIHLFLRLKWHPTPSCCSLCVKLLAGVSTSLHRTYTHSVAKLLKLGLMSAQHIIPISPWPFVVLFCKLQTLFFSFSTRFLLLFCQHVLRLRCRSCHTVPLRSFFGP